jgi:hypothetical protein
MWPVEKRHSDFGLALSSMDLAAHAIDFFRGSGDERPKLVRFLVLYSALVRISLPSY